MNHLQYETVRLNFMFKRAVCLVMVAAYVIGYSVTQQELADNPHLKFAEGPDDTGVIISYNTVSADFEGNLSTALPGAVTINPISWTREEKTAASSENAGSYVMGGAGYEKMMGLADATVDAERGLIICSTADVERYGMPEAMRASSRAALFTGRISRFTTSTCGKMRKIGWKSFWRQIRNTGDDSVVICPDVRRSSKTCRRKIPQ